MADTSLLKGDGPTKWKDRYLIDIYDLAKERATDKQIADTLGICHKTLARWIEDIPVLRYALDRAREYHDPQEYIHGLLPLEVQELWDQLVNAAGGGMDRSQVVAIMQPVCTEWKQWLFAQAMDHCNYSKSAACRLTGIPRSQVEEWYVTDPRFAEILSAVLEARKDFVESALMSKVRRGDTQAIIFANRTINRDRGYGDALSIKGQVEHSGSVTHEVQPVDLFALTQHGLPPEALEMLVQAMERMQAATAIPSLPAPLLISDD